MATGDTFVVGDYTYTVLSGTTTRVSVVATDKTKSSYASIPSSVTYNGKNYTVSNLAECFKDCVNLKTAPSIPIISNMSRVFQGCTSLTTAPDFSGMFSSVATPSSSQPFSMDYMFMGCTSLVNPPTFPTVPNAWKGYVYVKLEGMFYGCTSLSTGPNLSVFDSGCTIDLDYMFHGCSSLKSANLPALIGNGPNGWGNKYLWGVFYGCSNLEIAPNLPSDAVGTISACFRGCAKISSAPTIPNGITNMRSSFYDCSALEAAPTIPNGVTDIQYAFRNCAKIESVDRIPSSVTAIDYAFYGCASLTGSIIVANTPSTYGGAFSRTAQTIYIIPVGDADISTWHTIANAYSNVIFLAEANAKPALSFSVTRVSASGQTTENIEGTWAYIVAVATAYYDHLPEGYTNAVGAITLTANGSSTSPTWVSDSIVEGEYKVTETRHTWLQISTIRHVFAMRVVDSYDASSPTITVKLPSTNTLLDFLPGGNGMAIGKVATRDAFDCVIPAYFDDVEVDGDLKTAGHVLDMSGNAKYLPLSGGIEMETDTSYFTPNATNVDLASFHATTYGKVCMLTIGFQPKAAWAASAPLAIGTVASAYRSAWRAGGANVNVSAQMSTAGVITARNITGVQLNAGVTQYVEMVYLLA